MGPLSLLFTVLLVSQHKCDPVSDDDIRDDIEDAARDSKLLAEELAAMLDRLEGGEDEEDRRAKSLVEEELERALKTTEELSKETRRRKEKKYESKKKSARRGKQGFDSDFIDVLLDSLNIDEKDDLEFDEEFKNSGRRTETPEEIRSSSGESKVDDLQRKAKSNANETCEEKEAKSQVQVCVPEYEVQPQRLYFAAQETYDEKYCYTKTNTECEFKSKPIKRQVCTHKYLQKQHNVPATNVEVAFERHSEKMGVTNCKHIKDDYGHMKEVCQIEYISVHYKLPVIAEEVLELISVEYPEPEEECLEAELEELSTECDHDTEEYCVGCAHIRDSKQDVTADKIYPSRYGKCEDQSLSLDQSLCLVEQRIKVAAPRHAPHYHAPARPPPSQYGQPRAYSGARAAFTAFQ